MFWYTNPANLLWNGKLGGQIQTVLYSCLLFWSSSQGFLISVQKSIPQGLQTRFLRKHWWSTPDLTISPHFLHFHLVTASLSYQPPKESSFFELDYSCFVTYVTFLSLISNLTTSQSQNPKDYLELGVPIKCLWEMAPATLIPSLLFPAPLSYSES